MSEILYCCIWCFESNNHQAILNVFIENSKPGNCSFCHCEKTSVLEPRQLRDLFRPLVDRYKIPEKGVDYTDGDDIDSMFRSLSDAINEWGIFPIWVNDDKDWLLDEIMGYDENNSCSLNLWCNKNSSLNHTDKYEYWNKFEEYIKHDRRFFLNFDFLPFDLEELFRNTETRIPQGTILFRARIGGVIDGRILNPYPLEEMLKPPAMLAGQGRANPTGISYLYLASDVNTALVEVKASVGDYVTIAEIQILGKKGSTGTTDLLKVSDFIKDPYEYINPFDNDAESKRESIRMLSALNERISKPVNNKTAPLEYIPTQFLTELVRDLGFDGIKFRSSIHEKGYNYAFFYSDEDKGSIFVEKTYLVEVTNHNVDFYRQSFEIKNPEPLTQVLDNLPPRSKNNSVYVKQRNPKPS